MRRASPILARLACDLLVALLLLVWVGSYWWSAWAKTRGAEMVIDRGAYYFATDGYDGGAFKADVKPVSEVIEVELSDSVKRWLPVRRIELPRGGGLYIVSLWVPTALAAGLAWWGGRRRRSKARGFAVEPAKGDT